MMTSDRCHPRAKTREKLRVTAAMFQAMRDALAEQKQNPLSIDDVAAMVAGQIGQLTPMDEETADLFKQLAKKMMKGIE